MPKIPNFVTPSTKLLTRMLPAVFTSLLQHAFTIYLMDNLKRMLRIDFVLIVCKMSSSNSREFGMNSFLIWIATPHNNEFRKTNPKLEIFASTPFVPQTAVKTRQPYCPL